VKLAIHLAASLGLRRGEVLGLRWDNIDFNKGIIRIEQNLIEVKCVKYFKEPKSDTSRRTIYVSDSMLSILQNYRIKQNELKKENRDIYQDYDLVVCNSRGELLKPDYLTKMFTKYLRENNLPKIRFHDLRHTNATLMLEGKVPPKIASKRLGHSSIGITMDLYSHVPDEMDREASHILEDFIYKK